jgi:exopolysaccharide biosynthesis polyprenyl glycosylphosphotransferase
VSLDPTLGPRLDPLQSLEPLGGEESFPQRSWPSTLLASGASTLALAAALALPVVLAGIELLEAVLLAPFVALGIIASRWSFDSRSVRVRGRLSLGAVVATLPPSALAIAVATGSAAILGVGVSMAGLVLCAVAAPAVLAGAAAVRAMEVRYLRASRRIFLVSSAAQRTDVAREIRCNEGMALVGFLDLSAAQSPTLDRDALLRHVQSRGATMLVLAREAVTQAAVVSVASDFNLAGGRVRDLGSFYERHFGKTALSDLTPSWFLFDIAEIHRSRVYGVVKRGADIAIAAALGLVTAPLVLVLAGCVRASSPGPVFFRQLRVGKGHQPFTVIKLRTMRVSPGADTAWAGEHTDRVTPLGAFLRRYRLDELPQLWTVLRGDMSIVGPRPEQVPMVDALRRSIEFYEARHAVRPGLTGWAQVNAGYSGSHQGTLEKLQYDFYYIRHQGLRLDALILVRTFKAVLRGQGSA